MKFVLVLCVLVAVIFSASEAAILGRCESLKPDEHGQLTGDWANYREGRMVGIRCVEGYKLNGPNETLCKNGQWTNDLGTCEVVKCSPLKTGSLSITNPPSCKEGPVEYGTHCFVSCPPGYGQHEAGFYCSHDGQWEGMDAVCNDYQPPVFEGCAQDPRKLFTVETDPGKATAKVRLPVFRYSDNSQAHGGKLSFSAYLNGKPVSLEEELELDGGRLHYVRYMVRDEAGNEGICRMTYRVEDKEAPKIKNCPRNITKTITENTMVRVSWKQPSVTDNSGAPRVVPNRISGSLFPPGKHMVYYSVTDRAGNEASCKFTVTVIVKYRCVDHSLLAAHLLAPARPPADPNTTCSHLASYDKTCDDTAAPLMPDVLWSQICRKSCKAC